MSIEASWKDYLAKVESRPVEAYDANAYDALRDPIYTQLFGGAASHVVMEPIPSPPFVVGVHLFNAPPPVGGPAIIVPGPLRGHPVSDAEPQPRNWTTLATMGMSNERMPLPPEVPTALARVELLFYLSWDALAVTPDLIHFCSDMLLYAAKYPFLEGAFLAPGHIVPVCVIGQGPARFLNDDSVNRLLLLPPPSGLPEGHLSERLQLAGDPVSFLAVIPIVDQELNFIRANGLETFLAQCDLPLIYDGPRPPCV
jgi:Suppressor of fused protein (SUFU)